MSMLTFGGDTETKVESSDIAGRGLVISQRITSALGNNFIWALVVILAIAAWIANPVFMTSTNLLNILNANAYLICMVLGISLVLITGNIDISLESNLIFTSMVGGIIMMSPSAEPGVAGGLGWPWPLALGAMLVVSSLVGFINGYCVVKFRMSSLMVTIASMLALLGAALVLGRTYTTIINLPGGFRYIGDAQIGGVSVAVIFVGVLLIIAAVWMKKSVFGAHLYAVGGNRGAARAAGVNDGRVIITAFVLCGFLAGLSAFILIGRLGTASPGISNGAIFLVVAAAIVGGVSLFGGRGGVGGMVGGLLLIGMITNVLSLARISSLYVNVVTGCIILFALGIDSFKRRKEQIE